MATGLDKNLNETLEQEIESHMGDTSKHCDFTPEIGQFAFGNPHQRFEAPEFLEAVFMMIERELARVRWNVHQKNILSPFGNNGPEGNYEGEIFSIQAYSWSDEEQPWNFKWRDLRVSWYKYFGRGMSTNIEVSPDMASLLLDECLREIRSKDYDESLLLEDDVDDDIDDVFGCDHGYEIIDVIEGSASCQHCGSHRNLSSAEHSERLKIEAEHDQEVYDRMVEEEGNPET